MTTSDFKSLYLFADSQLLFWKRRGRLLLEEIVQQAAFEAPRAAYIGASNGDRPEFYEIFAAAMQSVGIAEYRHIDSAFSPDARDFLESAHVILLAGGEVRVGWDVFERTGMKDVILARYAQGAVLIGISAGAVQLGRQAIVAARESAASELLDVFNLVHAVVDAHDERNDWSRLSSTIHLLEGAAVGLGIPTGGGVAVHPDGEIEPLRQPAHEFRFDGSRLTHSLLCPAEEPAT
ncbi:MAG TPA: Type 1 glutamine amidotransferase-like domain-containing protein [Steroidobacteraceae bacterium]